jgi:outer membrane autotransporter protein
VLRTIELHHLKVRAYRDVAPLGQVTSTRQCRGTFRKRLPVAGPAVELGGGVNGKLTRLLSVYGNASYLTSVQGERNTTVKGNVGLHVAW